MVGAERIAEEPIGPPPRSPLTALERAVLPALLRPPCLVSFSGGTDSSTVLAVATRVARRHGLADPVPCTWRVADAPQAEESAAQHAVIDALGLSEWLLLAAEDDLDLVGPVARRLLHAHGVLYPANLHLHLPLVERARGGSLLTGAGGDQILSGWRRPTNLTPVRRLKNRIPAGWRARLQHRGGEVLPWLRPAVAHQLWSAHLAELAAEPRRLDRRVQFHASRRSLQLGLGGLRRLGDDGDVTVLAPLVDPGFVASLARFGGPRDAPRRSQLVAAIVGDAIPAVAYQPRPKARFLEVFFRGPTRELVRSWDGSGVDPSLVDLAALRRRWSQWPVPPGTAGLVQQVLLAGVRSVPELPPKAVDR